MSALSECMLKRCKLDVCSEKALCVFVASVCVHMLKRCKLDACSEKALCVFVASVCVRFSQSECY